MEFRHKSVLLYETVDSLEVHPEGVYVDGTLGGGGHSCLIAGKLTTGRLIGIDRDEEAISAAKERLKEFSDKVTFVKSNYGEIKSILQELGIEAVDGIILDLGVSSYQLDNADRGFSYMEDAPLDMRMDAGQALTAETIINEYSEEELFRVIRDYGEDRFAKNIAKHIVAARKDTRIRTTFELNEIIKNSIPAKIRATGGHPSKRTFQAIRIECNSELEVLQNCLNDMIDVLKPGGRLSIITFHSLEDRIVKTIMRTAEDPCICPKNFPKCVCNRVSKGAVITRKPIVPDEAELEDNSRSKSAKLRVFEKRPVE